MEAGRNVGVPPAEEGTGMRALLMAVLIIAGLVVAGSIVVWAVHALLGVLFWVVVGALAVGAVVFVAGRVRNSVGGGRARRQVR